MTILRSAPLRSLLTPAPLPSFSRTFSTHPPLHIPTRNRIYDPVRSPPDFDTLLLLTTSSRTPLLTLWTASYSPPCRTISPLLHHLLSSERVGEAQGGVAYAEIEFDSPTLGAEIGERYLITSVPTLMAFSRRGEAQVGTRVEDVREMGDRTFLRLWIEDQAQAGRGGGGGGGFGIGGMSGFEKGGE